MKMISFSFDSHCDLPLYIYPKRAEGERSTLNKYYLKDMRDGGLKYLSAAIFIPPNFVPEKSLENAMTQLLAIKQEIKECSDNFMLCTSREDLEAVEKSDKIGVLLSIEGSEPFESEPEMLELFHELGIRIISLTWSRKNSLADGCGFEREEKEEKFGLTENGKRLLDKAKELNIIIDLTHLSEKAFWDVLEYTSLPVFASHTNAQAVFNIKRNFTDEQIKAISDRKGVIGVNGVSNFVAPTDEESTKEFLAKHITYMKNLCGVECVGLGLDLFVNYGNVTPELLRSVQDGVVRIANDVVYGHNEIPLLQEEMKKAGLSETDIKKISGENFLNFFKNNL